MIKYPKVYTLQSSELAELNKKIVKIKSQKNNLVHEVGLDLYLKVYANEPDFDLIQKCEGFDEIIEEYTEKEEEPEIRKIEMALTAPREDIEEELTKETKYPINKNKAKS